MDLVGINRQELRPARIDHVLTGRRGLLPGPQPALSFDRHWYKRPRGWLRHGDFNNILKRITPFIDPERLRQIEELYRAARARSPQDRASLLEQASPDVRREVESLLKKEEGATGSMDRRPVEDSLPSRLFRPCPDTEPSSKIGVGYEYNFDTRDGRHFLVNCLNKSPGRFVVLLNWAGLR